MNRRSLVLSASALGAAAFAGGSWLVRDRQAREAAAEDEARAAAIAAVFLGPENEKWSAMPDLDRREMTVIVPLLILTVLVGVAPGRRSRWTGCGPCAKATPTPGPWRTSRCSTPRGGRATLDA